MSVNFEFKLRFCYHSQEIIKEIYNFGHWIPGTWSQLKPLLSKVLSASLHFYRGNCIIQVRFGSVLQLALWINFMLEITSCRGCRIIILITQKCWVNNVCLFIYESCENSISQLKSHNKHLFISFPFRICYTLRLNRLKSRSSFEETILGILQKYTNKRLFSEAKWNKLKPDFEILKVSHLISITCSFHRNCFGEVNLCCLSSSSI